MQIITDFLICLAIIIGVIIPAAFLFQGVTRSLIRAHRYATLRTTGRTVSLAEVDTHSGPLEVVLANFGFGGEECWVLPLGRDEYDYKTFTYAHGKCVVPRPRPEEIARFCEEHRCPCRNLFIRMERIYSPW